MDELISRQEAIDSIMEEPSEVRYPAFYAEKIRQLSPAQPTADVQELKHGRWLVLYDDDSPQDGVWECSECGYLRFLDDCSPMNFCPECGADMRKESDDAKEL